MKAIPLDRLRECLTRAPRLGVLLEDLLTVLATPSTTIAVSGSLARGELDRWSDLDVVVLAADPGVLTLLRTAVQRRLVEAYDLLALFDAAHLSLDCLDSAFVVLEGVVVKVDITYWATSDGPAPGDGVVVHRGAAGDPVWAIGPDEVAQAPHEITGWTCHTRKLLARGELLEVGHCLDEMRRRFLTPVLLELAGAPQVNYRRVEQRLPVPALWALTASVPAGPTAADLQTALVALLDAFAEAYSRLPVDRRSVPVEDVLDRLARARTLSVG
ncbi:hypothetical protein MLP_18620 [Microlunatus phosphovorus NM-1]|uniref:Polymerase nucleotidyl transferase domain-containing protein n=1 Tax=Microlunatus phosphovorus (strain ATCC 700054 / DSM 10555 / JCM 9379 / NBRC 101784 / NCIMB 13414 / VKM Ac-1990 / NM-1) TaxID=1032480 RepID=F5XT04_MICPN|nr:nucleotidyltransferase domain-containing protein [Microlunatus phosphovorus]BAK34876.1 hypothetical protein MLP_18620 [Microlunatus phosphovorus NM-1]